jgi:hypothetical protein
MGSATRKIANAFSTSGVIRSTNINNASLNNITTIAGAGDMVLISSQTASASASISFTSGIDSTYKEYVFYFVNIHPATNNIKFTFNMSTDSGASYNVTKTTTFFQAYHEENDTDTGLSYSAGEDLAQGTGFQSLAQNVGNGADESVSGSLTLFNPSSTTYVKHFISRVSNYEEANRIFDCFSAGYGNTTSAVNAIQFQISSGNIDDGKILMFGVN